MTSLRHSLAILFLATASLLAFARHRFSSRALEDVSPPPARSAISPRVALVVLDGMRDDRFRSTMPRAREIAEAGGALCAVEAPPITFTIAGVYTLGTGDAPSFALIPQNFEAQPARVDSLPAALGRVGGRTMLLGDPVWRDLFGHSALPGDAARDLGPYAEHDDGGLARLGQAVERQECELCVAHVGRFDAIGHKNGVYSEEYGAYAREVDGTIAELSSRLSPNVTWLLTSDHGMFDGGGHGGNDPPARASFLAAWGPGILRATCPARLEQADIPTLTSVLLGAPIPFQSHGTVPPIVAIANRAALDRELLDQKQILARKLAARHGERAATLESIESCRAVIAAAEGAVPFGPMLISIFPLLLAFFGVMRPSEILRPAAVRGPRTLLVLALVSFGWVFSNLVYPRFSYTSAMLIAFAAGVAPFAIAWLATGRGLRDPSLAVAVGVATVVAMEAHFVSQLQAFVLGFGAWLALAPLRRSVRLVTAVTIGIVAFALVEASWLRVLTLRASSHGPVAVAMAALVSALVLSSVLPQDWSAVRRRAIAGTTAAGYALLVAAPPFARPWLPFLVIAALFALAAPRSLALPEVLATGFGALVAMQAAPLYWCALLLGGRLGCELISAPGIEHALGSRSAAWLRGALLLAIAYVLTVIEGNRIRFEDVDVLVGFFGGGIDLHLPLTVTLVATYYAAPVIALLLFTRRACGQGSRLGAMLAAATALCLLRVASILIGFVWGNLAEGSWTMQLTDVLLLSTWIIVLVLGLPLLDRSRTVQSKQNDPESVAHEATS